MNIKNIGILATCLVAGSLMVSCGGSSSSTATASGGAAALMVDNILGGQTDISGLRSDGCHIVFNTGTPVNDEKFTKLYSGSSVVVTGATYTSLDGTCSGTATITDSVTVAITVQPSTIYTNWVDFNGATVAAPTAADASGPLPNTGTLAILSGSVSSITGGGFGVAVGDPVTFEQAVDASAVAVVIWRGQNVGTTIAPSYVGEAFDPETKALAL